MDVTECASCDDDDDDDDDDDCLGCLNGCYGSERVVMMLMMKQAAICRCSQPLSGFSARCVEDESLLQAIRKANPSSKYMFVVDMRPKVS